MLDKKFLIIAGVNKSATSSLFTYLKKSPYFSGSFVKETCFFLPLRFNSDLSDINNYFKFYDGKAKCKYFVESTPGYYYGGEKISNYIKKSLPNSKIILIFRNPTDRTESFIKHCISRLWIDPKSNIDLEITNTLKKINISNDLSDDNEHDYIKRAILESIYSLNIEFWLKDFNNKIYITFFEDLKYDSVGLLKKIHFWLDIKFDNKSHKLFKPENVSLNPRNKTLHKISIYLYSKFESFFRNNNWIKNKFKQLYLNLNNNSDDSFKLDFSTRNKLDDFFKKHNSDFHDILASNGLSEFPNWLKKHNL
jgi:hypothetical protein